MKTHCLIILFAFLLPGCETDQVESDISLKDTVEWGYSFGECMQNCSGILVLKGSSVSFSRFQYLPYASPTLSCSSQISEDNTRKVSEITGEISFATLDETYGCPDCSDGGKEWIRLLRQSDTLQVSYEYQKPPQELKALSEWFHDQYSLMQNCK